MTPRMLAGTIVCGTIAVGFYLFLTKKRQPKKILNGQTLKVKLSDKQFITNDVRRFRFMLPDKHAILGLPLGMHINIKTRINGKLCIRSYTPITVDKISIGFFDLMIKIYPDGKISNYLDELDINDEIEINGPVGQVTYNNEIHKFIKFKSRTPISGNIKKLGLLSAGSGITPMLQLIRSEEFKNTEIKLIYSNKTLDDILCRTELLSLSNPNHHNNPSSLENPEKLSNVKIHHAITREEKENFGGLRSGETADFNRIDKKMMVEHLGGCDFYIVCGPKSFNEACLDCLTSGLKVDDDDVYIF